VLIIRNKIALLGIFGNGNPGRKKRRRKAALLPTRRVLLRGGAFGVTLESVTSGQPGVRLRMSLALRGGTTPRSLSSQAPIASSMAAEGGTLRTAGCGCGTDWRQLDRLEKLFRVPG